MIRHTYTYQLEETGETDWIGRPEQREVWNKKVVFPRYLYVLTWTFCVLFAPLAIVAPIVVGGAIGIDCSKGEARFIYTNRLIEWLKKEV